LDVANRGEPIPVYMDAIGKSAEWILRTLPIVVRDHGIDIVFVDYIQEIYAERRFESEQLMLKWVARELRATFKRLSISGTIVSQITPTGERPRKENVRQCKDIVHGAEVIAIGYEPEKDFETKSAGLIPAGTKCLILEKNKDGPKGVVPLVWDPRVATFWDEPENSYDYIDDLHDRVVRRNSTPPDYDNWTDV
jgi:replicative DNA helicase